MHLVTPGHPQGGRRPTFPAHQRPEADHGRSGAARPAEVRRRHHRL